MNVSNEVKVYSPQDIYDSHVSEVCEDDNIEYIINSIMPNCSFCFTKPPTRINIKLHGYEYINDDCVVIHVHSLWFDELPIMVLLNSFDYNGRCYESTYITDEGKYHELIGYLHSLCETPFSVINKDEKVLKTVQPSVDIYIQQVLEK